MRFYARPSFLLKGSLEIVDEVTIHGLCKEAMIKPRVTSSYRKRILLINGNDHFEDASARYIGISSFSDASDVRSKEILECLAYGFFDYEAREIMRFHHDEIKNNRRRL